MVLADAPTLSVGEPALPWGAPAPSCIRLQVNSEFMVNHRGTAHRPPRSPGQLIQIQRDAHTWSRDTTDRPPAGGAAESQLTGNERVWPGGHRVRPCMLGHSRGSVSRKQG